MSTPEDPLTNHMYDGIQEYDNPQPFWWTAIFWASVIFSICYIVYYHAPVEGRSLKDEYEQSLAANLRLQFREIGSLTADRETIVKFMNDPEWIQVGKIVYQTNCASCHGVEGEGRVGPNLTDDFYKNVKEIEDIANVIKNGAKIGAMPAWKDRLHPNEIVLASSYIASLRGTSPATSGRPPEGTKIAPWPALHNDHKSQSKPKPNEKVSQ